jgi:hypothetical protein
VGNKKETTAIIWKILGITWRPGFRGICTSALYILSLKYILILSLGGTRWRSWLRHCATSRKVTGSILYGVTGIFHLHSSFGRYMALGLAQPLTEMSTRNIYWGGGGKDGRCVGLTTLLPSCANCLEI